MAQLIYYENRGFAEIIRMLMTLADIEVSNNDARFTADLLTYMYIELMLQYYVHVSTVCLPTSFHCLRKQWK